MDWALRFVDRTMAKARWHVKKLVWTASACLLQTQDEGKIRTQALAQGMNTLRADGIDKVIDGIT